MWVDDSSMFLMLRQRRTMSQEEKLTTLKANSRSERRTDSWSCDWSYDIAIRWIQPTRTMWRVDANDSSVELASAVSGLCPAAHCSRTSSSCWKFGASVVARSPSATGELERTPESLWRDSGSRKRPSCTGPDRVATDRRLRLPRTKIQTRDRSECTSR